MNRLMGLAVFGEKVAAKIYLLMARLRAEHAPRLREFAQMEGQHAAWFADVCRKNDIVPDRAFADEELGYLLDQVEAYFAAGDFDALAVVQGFIVESLAIATYEPFLEIADRFAGAREVFTRAAAEEHYHVDWITRYLRLRFFDAADEFMALAARVNVQGIDCIGGSMLNIAGNLDAIGMSGASCTAAMMDVYSGLLERVGVEQRVATKNVVGLFMPLLQKYRQAS